MVFKQNPPRGYRSAEYPLPHSTAFGFSLAGVNETKNTTIYSIFHASESAVNPETVEVNPSNAAFAEDAGACIHPGSIIPKVRLTFQAHLTDAAVETDKLRALKFYYMPIYTAFIDTLEAEDTRIGATSEIQDIIGLSSNSASKRVLPLYSGTDMLNPSNVGLSTIPYTETFANYGLTTNALIESVAFDKQVWLDALHYYSNQGMLRKVCGPMKQVTVTRDRPFNFFSNNFTNPMVKRGNPFTFCGIMFHMDLIGSVDQYHAFDGATDVAHITIGGRVRFDEWNSSFDQAAF